MMKNVTSNFTIWEKLREWFSAIVPVFLVLMVFASFTMSVASLSKSVKTQAQVSALASEFSKTTKDLELTMNAIEGHLAFLEKYLGDHASFFYDNDRVVINNKTKSKNK